MIFVHHFDRQLKILAVTFSQIQADHYDSKEEWSNLPMFTY